MLDYGAIATALLHVVRRSRSAEEGWIALVAETERHGPVPPDLRAWDAGGDAALLRGEVMGVLEREPPPPGTGFLYFGLFEAWDEETDDPVAGFSLAGGPGDGREGEMTEDRLSYLPASRWFTVPLLDAVQAAPARGEHDPVLMQYALLWAAAALLVKHAAGRALDPYTVIVGFDEGDRIVLRTPVEGGG